MLTKRENRLSGLMIIIQVIISMALIFVIELIFPLRIFNLKEKLVILIQIGIVWSYFLNKFRLGVIFRENFFLSMVRGYLVTIIFGSALFYFEVQFLPLIRHIGHTLLFFVLFACVDLIALVAFKTVFYYQMKYLRRKGHNSRSIILIADKLSAPFVDSFIKVKDWGYKIHTIISPNDELKDDFINSRIIKSQEELKNFITQHPVDDIFYCLAMDDKSYDLAKIIQDSEEIGVTLHIIQQDYLQSLMNNSSVKLHFDNSFVTYSMIPQNYFSLKIKDTFDLIFSTLAIIALLPFMAIIALLVKLEDGGLVFFKQERIGRNGRRFNCYKFRSMITNAEELLNQLQHRNESDGPTFKIENDPRITKIGRILRKTSLDELPQFYNVIKGEMSVVGPRPPLLSEVQQYERWQLRRLSMKPGITCKWQVWGRNQVSFKEWMQMDLDYIDNWSLTLDFKIMLATVGVILKANGQ